MNKEELIKGLNDRQREAVKYTEGPLLILAGAGSGKTRILTHRIGYLIADGVSPWNILAITFTNKAANEMRERVDALLDTNAAQAVFVSTFHSLCVRLLRRDISKLGYGRDFTIYDTDDQKTLIRQCIKTLNLDNKMYRDRAVQSRISSAKNMMFDADMLREDAVSKYEKDIARIYAEYEKQLRANNALDFDDLLIKSVELFKQSPEVLEYWQERFRYIMVDEYQDTNNVQFELIRLLAAKYGNLCVVGDDDQSIYRFRGANIENILSFEKVYPDAKVIKLEQNYRSTKSILNAANEVIKNNKGRKEKKLWTENEEGALPDYTEYDSAPAEADEVIRKAADAAKHGVRLKDQAILYRTNAQSRLFEEKCVRRGVPYVIVGGVNFYQRKEIKDILSYLRIIANGTDDLAYQRIINVPKRGIGQTSVDKVNSFAAQEGISFGEALNRCSEIDNIGAAAKRLDSFVQEIEKYRQDYKESGSISALIEAVRDDSGYADEMKNEDPVSAETRLENIEELINKAVSSQEEYGAEYGTDGKTEDGLTGADASWDANEGFEAPEPVTDPIEQLSLFLEDVSLVSDIDRTDPQEEVITMMTLHAAKGLEFDTVYLCGMEDGLFPSAAAINSDNPEEEIEEERRLCYVGFTRARRVLHLSSAMSRMVNGDTRYMKTSRFIDEIPDDEAEKHFRRERGSRREGAEPFAQFGGYEGRMEYGLKYGSYNRGGYGSGYDTNKSSGYGASYGNGYGANRSSGYGSTYTESYGGGIRRAADSPYNAFDNSRVGRFGSMDDTPAGRLGKKSKAAALSGLAGINKGLGSSLDKQKPDYGTGDRVVHVKFGIGTVAGIEEDVRDYRVTVDFDDAGRKVMYAGFAKLKKV